MVELNQKNYESSDWAESKMAAPVGTSTAQLSSRLFTLILISLLTANIAQERVCITDPCSSLHVSYYFETDLKPVTETYSTQVVHHVMLRPRHGHHKFDRNQPLTTSTLQTSYKHILLLISEIEPNPGPRRLRFPCVVCKKTCKANQRALACDTCDYLDP